LGRLPELTSAFAVIIDGADRRFAVQRFSGSPLVFCSIVIVTISMTPVVANSYIGRLAANADVKVSKKL
jgi:hypothetical protein